jgi:hypothetical protein
MDLREIGCEHGRWMELVENHVLWKALILVVLNLLCLLPQCWLVSFVYYGVLS